MGLRIDTLRQGPGIALGRTRIGADNDGAADLGLVVTVFGIELADDTVALAVTQLVEHGFEPQEAADPCEERDIVDRLGEKIVRARFQTADPVLALVQRRDHDHGNMAGVPVGLEPGTGFIPIHARHHDVEQDQIGLLGAGDLDGLETIVGGANVEILGLEPGFQQPNIGRLIINDEDSRTHPVSS